MVTKRLYLQNGAQKKARFFSLMYFWESLCINRISHNYVIPQFLFCIIMPFRTSFHIPFRKLFPPFTLTGPTFHSHVGHYKEKFECSFHSWNYCSRVTWIDCNFKKIVFIIKSAFYPESAFYPQSAVYSLQSVVCILH